MSMPLPPDMQINRFQIESEVGRGGMGVVYRAADPVLKRPVALKLLAPHLGGDAGALARFHREAELVAGLKHPHIAIVYEFGEVEGRPYIAMEWIDGRDLKAVMDRDGPLSLERSLQLFDQLASALAYAHQQGVIHRDLKPANIIIGPDDRATIVDFGLAWLDTAPSITLSGSILGTPRYMSPEQIEGGRVDSRSDLYSLALILYEMLAGRPAFDAPTPSSLIHRQLFVMPPPITEINPATPPAVEAALMKALSKSPGQRFQSAQEFMQALHSSLPTLSLAEPEVRSPRWSSKRYWWAAAAVIVVLLVIVLAMVASSTISQPDGIAAPASAALPTPMPSTGAPAAASLPIVLPTPPEATSPPDTGAPRVWGVSSNEFLRWHFVEVPFAPLDPEARWTHYPDSGGHGEMVAADGLIVFNTADGVVRALDWSSGEVVWETRLGVAMTLPPGIYADDELAVVVLPAADALYALSLSDARLLWRIDAASLGGVIRSIRVSSDDNIIALTDTGQLHVIYPLSGEIYGALSLGERYASAYPSTPSDTALFLSADSGFAYALEIVTESVAWESGLNGRPVTAPLGDGGWGYVVVGTAEGWIHAFSSLTGQTVWEFQLDSPLVGLAADWERIYALTGGGVLYAWDAWGNELRWKVELDVPVAAGPVVNDEFILLGTEDGEILTLTAESGEVQDNRTLLVDEPVFALLPTGNWLFVRSDDAIYAFGPKEGD